MATAPSSIWQPAVPSANITYSLSLQTVTIMKLSISRYKYLRKGGLKFCLISCLLLANGMTGEVMAEEVMASEVMALDTLKQTEPTDVTSPEDSLTRYDRRIIRYRKHWDVLMPTQSVIQTCGNMGIISVGIGWDYGKRRQWETHLLFGIIPKYVSDAV